jgi:hypothetical protein
MQDFLKKHIKWIINLFKKITVSLLNRLEDNVRTGKIFGYILCYLIYYFVYSLMLSYLKDNQTSLLEQFKKLFGI